MHVYFGLVSVVVSSHLDCGLPVHSCSTSEIGESDKIIRMFYSIGRRLGEERVGRNEKHFSVLTIYRFHYLFLNYDVSTKNNI